MSGQLVVGEVLHGFCGGAFGRDHYECSRVEALGSDWIVVRSEDSGLGFASGPESLAALPEYRQEGDYCPSRPCPVQPGPDVAADRIRALHGPVTDRTGWDGSGGYDAVSPACAACGSEDNAVAWPCPTVRALDPINQRGRPS